MEQKASEKSTETEISDFVCSSIIHILEDDCRKAMWYSSYETDEDNFLEEREVISNSYL